MIQNIENIFLNNHKVYVFIGKQRYKIIDGGNKGGYETSIYEMVGDWNHTLVRWCEHSTNYQL